MPVDRNWTIPEDSPVALPVRPIVTLQDEQGRGSVLLDELVNTCELLERVGGQVTIVALREKVGEDATGPLFRHRGYQFFFNSFVPPLRQAEPDEAPAELEVEPATLPEQMEELAAREEELAASAQSSGDTAPLE